MPKKVVTIAGSDSLSGGGLQADLATFNEYGLFGLSVITSIVTFIDDQVAIHPVDVSILHEQLATTFSLGDIEGIKLGLLPCVESVEVVSQWIQEQKSTLIVVDPVLAFKEDGKLHDLEIIEAMKGLLFPFADIITPNLLEAEIFSGMKIRSMSDMEEVAKKLFQCGSKAVVIKGGTRLSGNTAVDLFFDGEHTQIFKLPKLSQNMNNGAGCTFASAILAGKLSGMDNLSSIEQAKRFVYEGILHGIFVNETYGNVWQAADRYEGGNYEK
ncbi:MAG: bifunctional hydroxymethylpyrimidine kinase/phosphomethylpyrimidine kinase [Lactobacillales bacterium]|nr:bifunctional hydroxymethylpyrimidine kinase/phosphomethylpyrimidine kinase [Lactobacillales bacterium]